MTVAPRNPLRDWLFTLANGATCLAVAAALGLSSMTLTALGVGYDTQGGSPLTKLHPASWLFALALVFNAVAKPGPLGYLAALPRRFPGVAFFAAMWALMIAFGNLVQHAPATPLIDTFFPAVALLMLHRDLDPRARAALRWFAHAFMFVNASLGIAEFLLHFRLTPFIVGDVEIVNDLRSTALLGHPLLNAGTTGAYMLMLFFGGHPLDRPGFRAAAMALQMVAMITFGGRTAIVLGLALLALGALPTIAATLAGRRFDRRVGLAIAVGLPMLIGAAFLALSQGFLTNLIERFTDDKGSSEARVVIFELFDQINLQELLLGPDPSRLASLQYTLGIEYGIENSWLGFVFQYGLLITIFFVIGVLALMAEFVRKCRPYSLIIVAYFLVLVSSSASLSVKSLVLSQFGVLILIIFDRDIPRVIRVPSRAAAPLGSRELSRA